MKKHTLCKLLCLGLVVLLAAAALTACKANTAPPKTADGREIVGEGGKSFSFDVTFADGTTTGYEVRTDAATVGEALVKTELIAGEDSEYGLYVKTVCGKTLDYDADGMYWAFYVNGEYAMTGVDQTEIAGGSSYAFVAEKG